MHQAAQRQTNLPAINSPQQAFAAASERDATDDDDMSFYRGELLTAGEDGQKHFQTIKAQMLGAGDRYRHPVGHAQAGQLNGSPGSANKKRGTREEAMAR